MAYRLEVTEHANELLDNPAQFPISRDDYLAAKGYHDAFITDMNYVVVFVFDKNTVKVMGIFHGLENYERKL